MALNQHQFYSNTSTVAAGISPHPSRSPTPNMLLPVATSTSWPESSDGGGGGPPPPLTSASGIMNLMMNFGACKVTLDVGGKMFVTLLHTLGKDMHSLLGKVALELASHAAGLSRGSSARSGGGSLPPSSAHAAALAGTSPSQFATNFTGLLYAHGIIIDTSSMHVFIDRDPAAFAHILNCLRNMSASSSQTSHHHQNPQPTTPNRTAHHPHQLDHHQHHATSASTSASPAMSMVVPPIPLDMFEAVLAEARFFRLYDLYARLQEQYTLLRHHHHGVGTGTGATSSSSSAAGGGAAAAASELSSHQQHDLLSTALDELRQLRQAIRDVQLCVTRSYDNGRFWVRA